MITFFLTVLTLNSFPSYIALLHNPSNMHTVALLGDTHGVMQELRAREQESIQQLKPYLNYLITAHLPYHTFLLESNSYHLYNILSYTINHKPLSEMALMQLLTILSFKPSTITAEQIPISIEQYTALYATIRDYLGIFPRATITMIPADNRIGAIQFLSIFDRIVSGQANDLYALFKQTYPSISHSFSSSIEWLDALFFNEAYQQSLLAAPITPDQLFQWKVRYTQGIIQELKDANLPFTFAITDAQKLINEEISFMHSLNTLLRQGNYSPATQSFFQKIKEKLEFIQTQLTLLKSYSPQNPTLLDGLIRFAYHFKTFKTIENRLSIVYGHKDETLTPPLTQPAIIDLNYALYYILSYYNDIGFLRHIMAEIFKNNNCFILAGASHCKKIADFLQKLGYQIIFTVDSPDDETPISNPDLSRFINQYFDYCNKKALYMNTLKNTPS